MRFSLALRSPVPLQMGRPGPAVRACMCVALGKRQVTPGQLVTTSVPSSGLQEEQKSRGKDVD